MDNASGRKAWERLLANVLAGGLTRWGSLSRGGMMLEADRIMDPRCGDYGAGWAGEGLEATARLSVGGDAYFNPDFLTGPCCRALNLDRY